MKLIKLLALAAAMILPVAALASGAPGENTNPLPPYLSVIAPNTLDGVTVNPTNAGSGSFTNLSTSGAFTTTGTIPTQGVPFSTLAAGNPFAKFTVLNQAVASATTAPFTVLGSAAGRSIYPGNILLEALGGNLAGATDIKILCNPSGNIIATVKNQVLTSGAPVSIYSSAGGLITLGAGFVGPIGGCAAGDSVQASFEGAAATTATGILISLPDYTVQ